MGEQVYAAVIGEVAGKGVSKVINAVKRPSVDEKLQRLEMLVIKLRGTVEMSERVGAETPSLLQWRDKLREAASMGHQVLLSFQRRRAADAAAAGGGGESSAVVSFTRDALLGMARGVRSAITAFLSCGECAVSFTRNTLVAMSRGFRSATTVMLSCGELNSTVDRLEKTCADIGEFIKLLQVEASQANALHRPTERKRTPAIKSAIDNVGVAGIGKKEKNRQPQEDALPLEVDGLSQGDATADQDALADALAMSTAVQRLQDALAEISRAVAVADGSGLADLEWLAELAEDLREDRQQGRRAIDNSNAKASVVISKEEKLPGVNEKLQRLEMLVVKLRCTVEVSETLGAETTSSLLQWRDKLREAASKGHQVLLSFQRRVMGANDAATAGAKHWGAGGKFGAVAFITKALLGMAKGVDIVITESLFDGEVAMRLNCLNNTVDRLEKVCADDIGDFIKLLQVEASRVKSLHMTTERKKSKFQTALEHTENVDVSENMVLQDSSVSREDDSIRRRRRRRKSFVSLSSSSSSEEDCSRSGRKKRRLTGLFSSLSSSSKEKDCFRSRDGSFISSPSEDWIRRRSFLVGEEAYESDDEVAVTTAEMLDMEERTIRRLAPLLFPLSSSSPSPSSSSPSPSSSSSEHGGGASGAAAAAAARTMPSTVVRFQAALAEIRRAEEMAGGRDLEGMEWMETWAYILRDATQRGRAMVIRTYSDSKDGEQANGGEQEAHDLCNAVHIMENLALDVECFITLVLLCPSI